MGAESFKLSLSFNQILDLVRQLPKNQKIKLTKELEKEVINSKLSELLKTFRTDALTDEVIVNEVNEVRQKYYERSKKNQSNI